jgi:hypothetical protein
MTENSKFVSAEEAVKALQQWTDLQMDNHNYAVKRETIHAAIEIIRSLPAVPQEEGPEAEARHAFCQTVHANLMWTHYEEASGFRVELL